MGLAWFNFNALLRKYGVRSTEYRYLSLPPLAVVVHLVRSTEYLQYILRTLLSSLCRQCRVLRLPPVSLVPVSKHSVKWEKSLPRLYFSSPEPASKPKKEQVTQTLPNELLLSLPLFLSLSVSESRNQNNTHHQSSLLYGVSHGVLHRLGSLSIASITTPLQLLRPDACEWTERAKLVFDPDTLLALPNHPQHPLPALCKTTLHPRHSNNFTIDPDQTSTILNATPLALRLLPLPSPSPVGRPLYSREPSLLAYWDTPPNPIAAANPRPDSINKTGGNSQSR
jgi:hypothetical protein